MEYVERADLFTLSQTTQLRCPPELVSVTAPSRRARLFRGIAWNTVGGAIAQGGSFVSSLIVARILGRQGFGQYAMVQSTVVALSVLAGLGLGITATKFVSEYRTTDPARVGRILGLSTLVAWSAAILFSVALLAGAPFVAGSLVPGLRLSTVYVLFITANACQVGALAGFEAFPSVARIGAISGISGVILTWIMVTRWGLAGAVLAQGIGAILLWSLYQVALRRECGARGIAVDYRGAWQERTLLYRFSIPAAASGMVAVAAVAAGNAILVRNAGFGELALFSAVGAMRSMVLFLPNLISRVTSPMLNHMKADGDQAGYRRTFRANVLGNGSIALALASALAIAGPQILRLFGKDFRGSTALLVLLLGSVVLEVIANSLFQALFTAGRLWRSLAIVCAWTALLTTCAVLTTPHYGAAGLAFSYLAAWSLSAFLYWRHV